MDEDDSPFQVTVVHEGTAEPIDEPLVREAVARALRQRGCAAATISLAMVDDERIAMLNREFLSHDGPTDCITFDLSDGGEIDGEVVISWETAAREARLRGRETMSEIVLYAVHGTLHLLGMDDHSPADAAAMHAVEDEILAAMGMGRVFAGGQ